METHVVRDTVRKHYGEIARTSGSCCGGSGCGAEPARSSTDFGYTEEQLASLPEGADLGLGCGNPLVHASVAAGETILDLGSGAGIDAFFAATLVGDTGHVIGVDMTPDMLQRARTHAEAAGSTNVEFRLGEIEALPVADESVDIVTSNCVINLSPEKPRVFAEALRVLRPGGRLVVSDLVWLAPPSADFRESTEALVGCVQGALLRDEYLGAIRDAGFESVEVIGETPYDASADCGCGTEGIASLQVRARKPVA
jgi:SAM-dependent methyltransferase